MLRRSRFRAPSCFGCPEGFCGAEGTDEEDPDGEDPDGKTQMGKTQMGKTQMRKTQMGKTQMRKTQMRKTQMRKTQMRKTQMGKTQTPRAIRGMFRCSIRRHGHLALSSAWASSGALVLVREAGPAVKIPRKILRTTLTAIHRDAGAANVYVVEIVINGIQYKETFEIEDGESVIGSFEALEPRWWGNDIIVSYLFRFAGGEPLAFPVDLGDLGDPGLAGRSGS
jgi:hypothetical protein